MMLVRTYLDKSPIHGIGVFAAEFIPQGTPVWEFNPLVDVILSPEQLASLPELTRSYIEEMSISHPFGADNYCVHLDHANFMNHSEDPNLSSEEPQNLALRDIPANTELTVNYFVEDHRLDSSCFD